MSGFDFKGGQSKYRENSPRGSSPRTIAINFYVFLVHDRKEIILYEAVRKGFIIDSGNTVDIHRNSETTVHSVMATHYKINAGIENPYLKVFTSLSGFGVQKRYMSKYIKIDDSSMSTTQILNLPPELPAPSAKFGFQAQGKVLSDEETRILLDGDSQAWAFYSKQAQLGVSTVNSIIQTGISQEVLKQKRVRRIRV
jgi:hypothetical protein